MPVADWLASRSPAPRARAAGGADTRDAARPRGEASVTRVRASDRIVLELRRARLGLEGPSALAVRLADHRAPAEAAVHGARMSQSGERGLKGPVPHSRCDLRSERPAWAA